MKRLLQLMLLIEVLLLAVACTNEKTAGTPKPADKVDEVELLISAAASLTDALTDLKPTYEKEHEGVTLTFNFGSSGKLATQIEQGAPSDVILSASKKDMDSMQEKKLVVETTRVDFAANALVLIANSDSTFEVASFEAIETATIDHFAIGEPETVPVGRYTKEVFEHLGLWEPLQNKIVLCSDVRQVLTHVEMGNADLGIVYSSDAFISDKVKVLTEANMEWHAPIVYPGAVVTDSKHQAAAQAFVAYLTSDAGKEVLQKYGFN